jgi:hypothetical protein
MIRLISVLVFLIVLLSGTKAQDVSFFREHITFRIEEGYFYVSGEYYLRRNDPSRDRIILYYPFPDDTLHSPADSIQLFDGNRNMNSIDYKKTGTGITFHLSLDSVTVVFISYRQKLKGNQARYILITTERWGEPLEEAVFELITDNKIHITSFTYSPDGIEQIDDKLIYYWRKENFMPLNDMVFTFQ